MKSQIFKKEVPIGLVFDLLDKICVKNERYFFLDHAAYKKMLFHKYKDDFLANVREYYHMSKLFYVDRDLTYNSFVNIVRQICKYNKVAYTSKIKYNESEYNINYYIYHNN